MRRAGKKFQELYPQTQEILHEIHQLERKEIGDTSYEIERLRLEIKGIQIGEDDLQRATERIRPLEQEMESWQQRYEEVAEKLSALYAENARYEIVVRAAGGKEKNLAIAQVVRAFQPNQMSWFEKVSLYMSRFWEFFWDDPRESNTEGGVFPAIFGTVMMVIVMSIVAVPFGVIAALYLREYAKQGTAGPRCPDCGQ